MKFGSLMLILFFQLNKFAKKKQDSHPASYILILQILKNPNYSFDQNHSSFFSEFSR